MPEGIQGIAWIEQGQFPPLILTFHCPEMYASVWKLNVADLNFGILYSNETLKEIPNIY